MDTALPFPLNRRYFSPAVLSVHTEPPFTILLVSVDMDPSP